MPNEGMLEVALLNVAGETAHDPDTRLTVRRGTSRDIVRVFRTSFPPTRTFTLPAFPTEHVLSPVIEPTRYRAKPLPFFTLTNGKTVTRNVTVFRQPTQWDHRFTTWGALSDRFDPLKTVLEASPDLRVRGAGSFDLLTGTQYSQAHDDFRVVLPKASLLNLFAKLTELREPIKKRKSWFLFVRRILEIRRERFIALVDPEMPARIQEVRDNIENHKDVYKRAPVGDHHKNLPPSFAVAKNTMFSIKTTEDHGNLQLTVGRGTDPDTGAEVWLLDTDIDENGDLFSHLGDLFKHRFTGGTHPTDIHEYLASVAPRYRSGLSGGVTARRLRVAITSRSRSPHQPPSLRSCRSHSR